MVDQPEPDPPDLVAPAQIAPAQIDRGRAGRRIRHVVTPELADGEAIVGWTRAWISRDGRFNLLLSARHRDFVVLTDQRIMLWSCGFFTRLPHRKVLDDRLGRIESEDIGRHPLRTVRVTAFQRHALRFDFGPDAPSAQVATRLLEARTLEDD